MNLTELDRKEIIDALQRAKKHYLKLAKNRLGDYEGVNRTMLEEQTKEITERYGRLVKIVEELP